MISRRNEIIIISATLLLAAILRMGWPGMTEFKADEARLLTLALDMVDGRFPLRGISSSTGFPNFPANVWVYALPLTVWPHPLAATLFTGFLNTLAVAGCYWFVRRYWGATAAIAATILFTVSPWAIIYSRKIWAQDLLPFFIMGWAIGAALALVDNKPKFIWLHFLCLALAVQIHLAAIVLIPATGLLLIIFRRRIEWRTVGIGIGLAGLTAVPFAIYLWQTWQRVGTLPLPAGESASAITLDSFRFLIMLSLGINIHSLAGPNAFRAYLAQVPPLDIVHWLWGALMLAGIIGLLLKIIRQRTERQTQVGIILLLWLFMPPLFFLWHTTPVFLHYLIPTLPVQYIIAGIGFSKLVQRKNNARMHKERVKIQSAEKRTSIIQKGISRLPSLLLLATAVSQLGVITLLFIFLAKNATPGGFGTPLSMKLEAVAQAKQMMKKSGANEIIAVSQGENPRREGFPAEIETLLRGIPHRTVDGTRSALFPANKSVVWLDGRQSNKRGWMGDLYFDAGTDLRTVLLRRGEGQFTILALPANAPPAPQKAFEPPHLLANWVQLIGIDLPTNIAVDGEHVETPTSNKGETAVWQIHWRTGNNPDPQNYHFFNHIMNAQGERISQADATAFAPWQWRAEDTVISRFQASWSEKATFLRVGMYQYPSLDNIPLLDVAANPYTDAAEIQLDLP